MKKFFLFIISLLCFFGMSRAQRTVIKGTVLNGETKTPLELTEVVAVPGNLGTVTDSKGKFELEINGDKTTYIVFQHVGFKQKKFSLDKVKQPFIVYLTPEKLMLKEVEISDNRTWNSGFYTETIGSLTLRKTNFTDLGAVLRETANISGIKKGSSGIDPVVRGFKFDQLIVLVNGAAIEGGCPNRMDPPTAHFDVQNIDEVRVYKGPFALKYGANFGGVILLETGKPVFYNNFENHFDFSASTQTNHTGNVVSGHLYGGNRHFYYKLGYTRSVFGDYKTGDGKIIPGSSNRNGTSGTVALRIGKNQLITINGDISKGKNVDFPTLSMDERIDDTRLFNVDYKATQLTKTLKTLHVNVYSATVSHLMDNKNRPFSDTIVAVSNLTAISRGANLSAGIDLYGGLLATGINYRHIYKDGTRDKYLILQPGLPAKSEKLWNKATIDNIGYFITYEKSSNRFTWTIGSRIDYNKATSGILQKQLPGETYINDNTGSNFYNFSFSAGVSKDISKSSTVSISAGSGTRSPNMTERYIILLPVGSDPYDYIGNPQLEPETNHELDLGYRHFSGKTGTLFLKLHFSYVTNYIGSEPVPPAEIKPSTRGVLGVKRFVNIPEAFLTGFEFSWRSPGIYRWHSGININYTAGLNPNAQAPVIEYGKVIGSENIGKDPLPQIPPAECNIFISYDFLNGKLVPDTKIRIAAPQKNISKAYLENESPGFLLVNLGVNYEYNQYLSFYGGVNNLLNSNYFEHLNRILVSSGAPLYEPGRIFYIKMNVKL